MNYNALINSAVFDGARFSITIPDGWMQGRTTYGGLSTALCLEAALRSFPGLPPLRSALISFVGPAGGAVEARAEILRRGKSVTFVQSDLFGEKGLATRCAFVFGEGRSSEFNKTFTTFPEMPSPEACEPLIPPGLGPAFAQHFETGLAKGARPFTGSDEYDHFVWVRHKDKEATTLPALLALADMPPPAVLPMATTLAPISSVTWGINFLTDAPSTRDGWWLLQTRGENAAEGYSSQDMLVWNRDGELVIAGRQSVAIFF